MKRLRRAAWACVLLAACGGETAPSSSGAAASPCHDEEFREDLYPHVTCDEGAHLSRDEDAGIVICRCSDLH